MEELGSAAFALALVGGAHDLLTRRIPNWLTFSGMLLGLAAQSWLHGWAGAGDGMLGILLGFLVFYPMFHFGYMGAGDAKLMMAVGAWMGWKDTLAVTAAAIAVGAVYALIDVMIRGRLKAVVWNTYSFLRAALVPQLEVEKLKVDESRKFAFGVCIAIGVGLVIFLRHQGRLG
jgi:prepilin peptidase CpaA